MAPRPGHKLLAFWAPPEFAAAITAMAKAQDTSRSRLLREAAVRDALEVRGSAAGRR